jgi:tetratricopeptide (TPR) repeat protein
MRFRSLFSVFLLVALLLGLIWVGLHSLALYYQAEAGRRLVKAQTTVPENLSVAWDPLLRSPLGSNEQMTQAIADLQTSLKYNSDDSQTLLLLGRAYLFAGQPDRAVEAYRNYIQLRPKNPLGHLELGFAYEAQCRQQEFTSEHVCPNAISEWQTGGLDSSQFKALGDSAFRLGHWEEAADWYERDRWYAAVAGSNEQIPFDLLVRQAVAAALAQRQEASALLAEVQGGDSKFQVYTLQDSVRIDGVEFRWMTIIGDGKYANYGTPLANGGSGTAGVLWWNGQAMALLSVAQDGNFSVRARLRNSDPPPVEMAIGIDGKQLEHITLTRGNDSWETITLPVNLTKGLHAIDLWYLNDATVNGKDRNAVVEWVAVERYR